MGGMAYVVKWMANGYVLHYCFLWQAFICFINKDMPIQFIDSKYVALHMYKEVRRINFYSVHFISCIILYVP